MIVLEYNMITGSSYKLVNVYETETRNVPSNSMTHRTSRYNKQQTVALHTSDTSRIRALRNAAALILNTKHK